MFKHLTHLTIISLCLLSTASVSFSQAGDANPGKPKQEPTEEAGDDQEAPDQTETYNLSPRWKVGDTACLLQAQSTVVVAKFGENETEDYTEMEFIYVFDILEVADDGSLTKFRMHYADAAKVDPARATSVAHPYLGAKITYTWSSDDSAWTGEFDEDSAEMNESLHDQLLNSQTMPIVLDAIVYPSEAIALDGTWETGDAERDLRQIATRESSGNAYNSVLSNWKSVATLNNVELTDVDGIVFPSAAESDKAEDEDDAQQHRVASISAEYSYDLSMDYAGTKLLAGAVGTWQRTFDVDAGKPLTEITSQVLTYDAQAMGIREMTAESVVSNTWAHMTLQELRDLVAAKKADAEQDPESPSDEDENRSPGGSKEN